MKDLSAIHTFITEDVTPGEMSQILDDACFNLAKFSLTTDQDDFKWGEVEEQIHYMKNLRDLFSAMD
jgi:hypothetical protein